MKIHSRPQHMRVYDKNFLTSWTSDFNGLTHDLPRSILDFRFWILDYRNQSTTFVPHSCFAADQFLLRPLRSLRPILPSFIPPAWGEERGGGRFYVTFVLFVVRSQFPLRPIGRAVHRDMLQDFAGHIVFQLDPRHRFVGALGHRRERPVRWLGRIDDHSRCLDLVAQ